MYADCTRAIENIKRWMKSKRACVPDLLHQALGLLREATSASSSCCEMLLQKGYASLLLDFIAGLDRSK